MIISVQFSQWLRNTIVWVADSVGWSGLKHLTTPGSQFLTPLRNRPPSPPPRRTRWAWRCYSRRPTQCSAVDLVIVSSDSLVCVFRSVKDQNYLYSSQAPNSCKPAEKTPLANEWNVMLPDDVILWLCYHFNNSLNIFFTLSLWYLQ